MRIIGHGIDIVEVGRIERLLEDPERDFVDGAFTSLEQSLAPGSPAHARYFAGRLAGKEAVVKALGTGFSHGVAWIDIEIGRGASGEPTVTLSERALEIAFDLAVSQWLLSISHSDAFAVASAIAVAG